MWLTNDFNKHEDPVSAPCGSPKLVPHHVGDHWFPTWPLPRLAASWYHSMLVITGFLLGLSLDLQQVGTIPCW